MPEDTKKFVEEIGDDGEYNEDEHFGDGRPTIEVTGEEDWDRWSSKDDGAYDCIEVYWFVKDDVLSDEDGAAIPDAGKFLGFDVKDIFEKTSGDREEDVRYVYNHSQPAIFRLIRKNVSFSRKRGMEEFGSDYDGDEDDSEDYLRSRV